MSVAATVRPRPSAALPAVCAALLPPAAGGPDPTQLADRVEAYLSHTPPMTRAGVRTVLAGIEAAAVATTGRRLARLTPEQGTSLLRRLEASAGSGAVMVLKAVVLLVAGSEMAGAQARAHANENPPARPDAELAVTPATKWPARSRADAVVVGSGAGGAVAARTLARAGMSVVVVEEGERWGVEDFRSRELIDRWAGLYRDGGATVAAGLPPVHLPVGRGVGGSTLINCGTSFRTPDHVLRRWRDESGWTLADPDRFGPLMDEIEATLQVAPADDEVLGRNGELLLAGAEKLDWEATRMPRGAPGCEGCCQCIIGCPQNAKYGVHLNALPQACEAGAEILTQAAVERVAHADGTATGVVACRPDGSRLAIEAPRVVVAAGATETPPLLRRSGLGGHPMLGRGLAIHPAGNCVGRFAESVVPWQGVQQSAAMSAFHDSDDILVEATALPQGMHAVAAGGVGSQLLAELGDADRDAVFGAMIGDRGSGRVLGKRRGRTAVSYRLDPDDGAKLVKALGVAGRALFAAGAEQVRVGTAGLPAVRTEQELHDLLVGTSPRQLVLAALHPTGSAGAGADPQRFPVAADGSLRGARGVWVADAAVLPSCPTVNPQVSIMSAALGIGEQVAAT